MQQIDKGIENIILRIKSGLARRKHEFVQRHRRNNVRGREILPIWEMQAPSLRRVDPMVRRLDVAGRKL